MSGPAIARSVPSSSRGTHGTIMPKPKRSTSSHAHRDPAPLADDHAHHARSVVAARHEVDQLYRAFLVSNRVSRIRVFGDSGAGPGHPSERGAIRQRPLSDVPEQRGEARMRNRSAASTASRSSLRGRPGLRSRDRRSWRSLRSGPPWCSQGKSMTTLMSPGRCWRLRPSSAKNATGDQAPQPVLIGALERRSRGLVMPPVGVHTAQHRIVVDNSFRLI